MTMHKNIGYSLGMRRLNCQELMRFHLAVSVTDKDNIEGDFRLENVINLTDNESGISKILFKTACFIIMVLLTALLGSNVNIYNS